MPPALLALAPLIAEGVGSFALPELIGSAGALGADALGLGLTDATLGSIGGGLAGAGAGALTNKDDPLLGGLLGGATGAIGGPGIADLGKSAIGGAADLIGGGGSALAGGGAGLVDPAAGAAKALAGGAGSLAAPPGGAAAAAAPATAGATPSISSTGPTADPGAPTSGTGPGDLAGGGDLGRALTSGGGTSLTGPGTLSSLAPPGAGVAGAPPVPPASPIAAAGGAAPPSPISTDAYNAVGSTVDAGPPGFLDDAMSWLGKGQHGSQLMAGLGLGATALQSQKSLPGEDALKAQAKHLKQSGSELEGYMRTGTLPPGLQAGVTGATESAKASLRSMFAQSGMSGSSSEAEALAKIDQQAQAQAGEMAIKLMQQGVDETNMSTALYQQIMQNALSQDQELGKAIGAFASSFAPRPAYQPGA